MFECHVCVEARLHRIILDASLRAEHVDRDTVLGVVLD